MMSKDKRDCKNGKSRQNKREFEKALLRLLLQKDYHDIAVNEVCPLGEGEENLLSLL